MFDWRNETYLANTGQPQKQERSDGAGRRSHDGQPQLIDLYNFVVRLGLNSEEKATTYRLLQNRHIREPLQLEQAPTVLSAHLQIRKLPEVQEGLSEFDKGVAEGYDLFIDFSSDILQ